MPTAPQAHRFHVHIHVVALDRNSGEATTHCTGSPGVALARDTCYGPSTAMSPTGNACAPGCNVAAA